MAKRGRPKRVNVRSYPIDKISEILSKTMSPKKANVYSKFLKNFSSVMISTSGNFTTAILKKGKTEVAVGHAKRNPRDPYKQEIGITIATKRAIDEFVKQYKSEEVKR